MSRICVGVDFGGTSIKFGAVDENNRRSETFQLDTPRDDGAQAVIAQMVRGVERTIAQAGAARDEVVGVGIGSPGPLDLEKGVIISLPNVPGMENVPLRDEVAKRVDLPTTLENDANAAAYGEFIAGAGRDTHEMVMLTLGTGVGSGIVHGGEIIHGAHGVGGEAGHLIVHPGGRPCGCGQRGCVEQYCSATFLAKYTAERIRQQGEATSLTEVLDANGKLTAKDIVQARNAGDALATEVWEECCFHLAIACVSICRLLDPDCIVLAGGLTNAGEDLLEPVRRHASEQNWTLCEQKTEIRIADLGADAGAVGAAGVAWRVLGDSANLTVQTGEL